MGVTNKRSDKTVGRGYYAWVVGERGKSFDKLIESGDYSQSDSFKVAKARRKNTTYASIDVSDISELIGNTLIGNARLKAYLYDIDSEEVVKTRGLGRLNKDTNNKFDELLMENIIPAQDQLF